MEGFFSSLKSDGVSPENAKPFTIQDLMRIKDECDKLPKMTPEQEAEAYAVLMRFCDSEEGKTLMNELGISDI